MSSTLLEGLIGSAMMRFVVVIGFGLSNSTAGAMPESASAARGDAEMRLTADEIIAVLIVRRSVHHPN